MVKGDNMAKLSKFNRGIFLNSLLEDADGILEIQRSKFPTGLTVHLRKINYVLTTRFTPYKGYYVSPDEVAEDIFES